MLIMQDQQFARFWGIGLAVLVLGLLFVCYTAPTPNSHETFSCKGTYSHPSCISQPSPSASMVDSGELTYLVGKQTHCEDASMEMRDRRMLSNGAIRVGERVWARHSSTNTFHLATVIRVFSAGDSTSASEGSTTYTYNANSNTSILTRPNPLFYYQEKYDKVQRFGNRAGLRHPQTHSPSSTSYVNVQPLSVPTVDQVDVMFDDQSLNQTRVQGNTQDLRMTVGMDVKRMPQSAMVDACAKGCLDLHPHTWGVQVGSCHNQTCKCQCLVHDGSGEVCDNVVTLEDSDIQTNLINNTLTDLHQLDSTKREQYLLYKRLGSSCNVPKPVQPRRFPCTASASQPAAATTASTSTHCPTGHCDQYTGMERELCMDQDKLTTFLNQSPSVTSVGRGVCTDGPKMSSSSQSCVKSTDIKCSKRTEDQCVTHADTDFYKCQWHTHDTFDSADHATGCYDRDMCMFSTSKGQCDRNRKCMWKNTDNTCVESAYCPTTCTSATNKDGCIRNPFCRWTNGQCKIKNVLDTHELRTLTEAPPDQTQHTILQGDMQKFTFARYTDDFEETTATHSDSNLLHNYIQNQTPSSENP